MQLCTVTSGRKTSAVSAPADWMAVAISVEPAVSATGTPVTSRPRLSSTGLVSAVKAIVPAGLSLYTTAAFLISLPSSSPR